MLQLVEHAALDASNKGFVAALDDAGIAYEIDQQNAQGDQSACQTIAEKLVNDGNDLILAIATPAAQAVAGCTTEIPIVVLRLQIMPLPVWLMIMPLRAEMSQEALT